MIWSRNGNCITEDVMEMPRCFSSAIQSEVACRAALRPLTVPAIWMAPPNSSSFSVRVVLPASGCEMMAKVRRRLISLEISASGTLSFLKRVRNRVHKSHRLTHGFTAGGLEGLVCPGAAPESAAWYASSRRIAGAEWLVRESELQYRRVL